MEWSGWFHLIPFGVVYIPFGVVFAGWRGLELLQRVGLCYQLISVISFYQPRYQLISVISVWEGDGSSDGVGLTTCADSSSCSASCRVGGGVFIELMTSDRKLKASREGSQ